MLLLPRTTRRRSRRSALSGPPLLLLLCWVNIVTTIAALFLFASACPSSSDPRSLWLDKGHGLAFDCGGEGKGAWREAGAVAAARRGLGNPHRT